MRIGVDVGGTNTDAVLISGGDVLAAVKRPTTADVSNGIVDAVQVLIDAANIVPSDVEAVMIGTTRFTNAFIQRRDLAKVFALRIGAPASRSIPPFAGWPQDVHDTVFGGAELVRGGFEFDGRPIAPFDPERVRQAVMLAAEVGVAQIAVSCIFSQINDSQEREAAEIIRQVVPGMGVSLSSELGRVGLLERENAAIMNASLRPLAEDTAISFNAALDQLGLKCPWYVSQNDGTLMSAEQMRLYPVLTFAAGPTNSLRGAAWLTGRSDAIVIDVGGTTTDIGVLKQGFPRHSSVHVDIGGVRTNFRMPDILSIGVGGGSIVRSVNGNISVGPDSVGFELHEKALIFGGEHFTASDVAVASGWADFGDPSLVSGIDRSIIAGAQERIALMVSEAIDRMKTTSDAVPAILVGGGNILLRETPSGIFALYRPEHAGVANAIGAAIAQVSGEIDRIYNIKNSDDREAAFDEAKELATLLVVQAGGTRDGLEIINLEAIPLQYLPGGATRVVCRAVSDLAKLGAAA